MVKKVNMKKRIKHFYESTEDIPLILDSYEDIFSDFDPSLI